MDTMAGSRGSLENLQSGRHPSPSRDNAETERNRIFTLILELLEYSHRVPAVRTILDGIVLPETEDVTLTSILESIASNDGDTMFKIRGLDEALASALATLAEQNLLSHSQPLRARKRKRTEFEVEGERGNSRNDIEDVIHKALKSLQNNIIDPKLLTTLQLRLHAIFVSAISTLAPSTPVRVRDTLSKISKLIQLLGVLSNVQLPIIPIPMEVQTHLGIDAETPPSSIPLPATPSIHPCPHPTCLKTFQKAYDLRIHSRIHANHRPFACSFCPATFTRSHDLQRHARTHPAPRLRSNVTSTSTENSSAGMDGPVGMATGMHNTTPILVAPAVRCTVCQRTFSRRDAFIRHTRGGRGKKGKVAGDGNGNVSESRRCAAAFGENVVNLPSNTPTRKRASRWDKSGVDAQTEAAPSEPTGLETLGQPVQSDSNDPFSIFSEMDLAQMEIDLGQLLALPQFTEHMPEIEL